MADVFRRCTQDRAVRHTAQLHRVVRDQPVPALHELHGCFALADAALAQDENALAVNLYKYAVPRDARRHLDAQVRNQRAHQTGCIFCGSQHGYFILGSELQHLVEHGKVARYDKRRRLCREQRVDMACLLYTSTRQMPRKTPKTAETV